MVNVLHEDARRTGKRMGTVTDSWTAVHVSHHQFCLLDAGLSDTDFGEEGADYSNGLIVVMSRGAKIHTGIYAGNVRVQARPLPGPPEQLDPGPWEEIVEAGVYSATGRLAVEILFPDTCPDTYLQLPELAEAGPGWYRLRAHARGRDAAPDAVREDPVEDYLLLCWPAEQTPTRMIRTTDRCGRQLRNSAARHPVRPRTGPVPDMPDAEQAYQQILSDNLRRRGAHRPSR